jgi:hypothetical protein
MESAIGVGHVVDLLAGAESRSLGDVWRGHRHRAAHLVIADNFVCSFDRCAPVFAYFLATVHKFAVPEIDSLPRAAVMTGVVMALDVFVVAPLFEGSYAMFRSVIGTWLPFAAIFLASWAA